MYSEISLNEIHSLFPKSIKSGNLVKNMNKLHRPAVLRLDNEIDYHLPEELTDVSEEFHKIKCNYLTNVYLSIIFSRSAFDDYLLFNRNIWKIGNSIMAKYEGEFYSTNPLILSGLSENKINLDKWKVFSIINDKGLYDKLNIMVGKSNSTRFNDLVGQIISSLKRSDKNILIGSSIFTLNNDEEATDYFNKSIEEKEKVAIISGNLLSELTKIYNRYYYINKLSLDNLRKYDNIVSDISNLIE